MKLIDNIDGIELDNEGRTIALKGRCKVKDLEG